MSQSGIFTTAFKTANPAAMRRAARPDAASNAEVLAACRQFYADHQPAVDACTTFGNAYVQDPSGAGVVSQLQAQPWSSSTLTPGMTDGAAAAQGSGMFSPALDRVNADTLLTTIGIGVSGGAQFFVGGAGGAGVVIDIAKREPPRGMGYAVGELGFDVNAHLNIEVQLFNQLPSALSGDILGLAVEAYVGLGARLAVFTDDSLTFRGFAIGVGVGFGGGATVFGGTIWNFT